MIPCTLIKTPNFRMVNAFYKFFCIQVLSRTYSHEPHPDRCITVGETPNEGTKCVVGCSLLSLWLSKAHSRIIFLSITSHPYIGYRDIIPQKPTCTEREHRHTDCSRRRLYSQGFNQLDHMLIKRLYIQTWHKEFDQEREIIRKKKQKKKRY